MLFSHTKRAWTLQLLGFKPFQKGMQKNIFLLATAGNTLNDSIKEEFISTYREGVGSNLYEN